MESYFIAVIMGLVEGLTEFLPVSSTGHLILAGHALGFTGPKAETFEVVIQFGAILAVIVLYWPRFWGLLRPKKEQAFSGLRGIWLLILTTLPGACVGLVFHSQIKSLFSPSVVAMALVFGAVLMLLVEAWFKRRPQQNALVSVDQISAKQALGIGFCQCLALWPGFSRSASTIMGGMFLGLRREVAAEYSFLAAVPMLVGAAGYDLIKSLGWLSSADIGFFVVGTVVAFVSALFAIKTFIALLGRVTLRPFAIYRLLLVIPVYFFLIR